MPPILQTGCYDGRDRRGGKDHKKSEIVSMVTFRNTLPDVPFESKYIIYPFGSKRFVEYNQTSLERSYTHELYTEVDLGVDLINPDKYNDNSRHLDPKDEELLEEDVPLCQDSKRSRHHKNPVSWLRKTEYISTEYNRFTHLANKAEARVGFNIRKDVMYKDRENQLEAIEDTFEAVKGPITTHYCKPGVSALEVLPVYPDFEMWKHPCGQVLFDSNPVTKDRTLPTQVEKMSQAMIRGMVDEQRDQFVAYFLPTDETMRKRKRDADEKREYKEGEQYDYVLAREYNWNVKNKAPEETYCFVMTPKGVFYNELETRVRLSKRRKLGCSTGAPSTNSRLIVKHRGLNVQEVGAQDARMKMLAEEDEED